MRYATNRPDNTSSPIVARAIRTYARNRGVSMTAVAAVVGVSSAAFYERMKGAIDWRLAELEAIAALLGVSVPELLVDPISGGDLMAYLRQVPPAALVTTG
jgi:transcriptional regulator with XRE-family HTH domain